MSLARLTYQRLPVGRGRGFLRLLTVPAPSSSAGADVPSGLGSRSASASPMSFVIWSTRTPLSLRAMVMASATIGSTLLGVMMRAFCPGLIPKPGRCDRPRRGGFAARRRAPGRSCSTSVILGRCLGYRGAGKSNGSPASGCQRSSSWILAACPSAAKSPGRMLAPMREAVDVLTNCRLGNVFLCVVDIQCPPCVRPPGPVCGVCLVSF